jgi:hypothetical protein
MVTAWDRRVFFRAFAAAIGLALLAGLVAAATDEGGLSFAVRASRTLPAVPLACGVGAALALAPARARGELLAHATLGRSPLGCVGAATLGAGAVGILAAALALAPSMDVSVFYPKPPLGQTTLVREEGAFVDARTGLRILDDGTPVLEERAPVGHGGGLPVRGRAAAALALAASALAFPMVGVSSRRRRALVVAGALATLLSLAAFQAAAVGRGPALLAALPPLLLLVTAAVGYRSGRWAIV